MMGVGYRYGLQGQEMDNEVKGTGNSINYKYRMHDPRAGRFFAVDPLSYKFAMLTPYKFAYNSTIQLIDMEGLQGTRAPLPSSNTWVRAATSKEVSDESERAQGQVASGGVID